MKVLKFCASKDTINRVKRQPTEWEKLFANHISNKELISRIHRELLKLNNKKVQTIWLKNGQKIWIDISPKKIYKWPISTWKDAQHHLSLGKHESKLWDNNLTSIRMATIKTKTKTKISIGEDVEKLEPLCTVGGTVKWYSHCGKQYDISSKD